MEDFLQQGRTSVTGPSGQGSLEAGFAQGPEIMAALAPYLQALDLGRLRATDVAASGGQPIAGARPIYDYAYSLGSPAFAEQARPASSTPQAGQLSALLPQLFGTQTGWQASEESLAGPVTAQTKAFAGLPPEWQGSIEDVQKYLAPGGAGYGRVEQGNANATYIPTNYGVANQDIFKALQGIQPGNYEQGLAQLFGQYGGQAPGLDALGFGQPAGAAPGAGEPGMPTDLGGLQRLLAAARPQAGALAPDVPDDFAAAMKNPAALQSLLSQPGLLARLFAPQGVA
jgi:hypothetical protein